MNRNEAQRELDKIHSELSDLYAQIREKEAEADKYNRIVHLEDYVDLPGDPPDDHQETAQTPQA